MDLGPAWTASRFPWYGIPRTSRCHARAYLQVYAGTPLLFRLLGKVFKREAGKKEQGGKSAYAELPPQMRALYDYVPETPQDLPLHAGDVVEIVGKRAEGWLEAKLPNGRTGIVPENYLESVEVDAPQVEEIAEMDRPLRDRDLRMSRKGDGITFA